MESEHSIPSNLYQHFGRRGAFDRGLQVGKKITYRLQDILWFYGAQAVRLVEDAVVEAGPAPHFRADYYPIPRPTWTKPDGIG